MRMQAWNVFLDKCWQDRVYFDADMGADQVKRALVNHDGYPSNITVKKQN